MVIQLVEQILHQTSQDRMPPEENAEVIPQSEDGVQEGQNAEGTAAGSAAAGGRDAESGFPAPEEAAPTPQRLEWKVTPVINRRIQESADHVDRCGDKCGASTGTDKVTGGKYVWG